MADMSVDFNNSDAPENDNKGEETQSLFRRTLNFVGELVHVVVISLAIILPIRYFLIQPFYVKGASMEPNFYDHEYLIIDEISYRFGEPERGDIVVFRYPDDPRQFFIKRVIGMPDERVVVTNGKIYIYDDVNANGHLLAEESYLGTTFTPGNKDVTLGEDEFYLMGDNRSASMDSRAFGPVPGRFIVGKVMFRGWPPEKMQFFSDGIEYDSAIGN